MELPPVIDPTPQMDALSCSFLPRLSKLLSSSSILHIVTRRQPMIRANLFTFHPAKKLIDHPAQTIETLNNNTTTSPSKHRGLPKKNEKISSPLADIFNRLDDFICTSLDLPLPPWFDPTHVLAGNFAPVDELPPTACEVVEGSLPCCLDGAYIRNGPNPQFIPKGPYHFLDGDGMLHMIKISQGKATFCSRYVKTHKYQVEHKIGYPFVPSIFASFNGHAATIARCILSVARVLTGQFDPVTHGFGVANTSLTLFRGHLFALCESDLPYELKLTSEGDIVTLGRNNFHSSEPFFRMTAHPKIDQETGEAFAYGYHSIPPFLTFFRINADGRKQKDLPINSMKENAVIHDFAVTKNYAIFPDVQIVVKPGRILGGKLPVEVDPVKAPRLGIIPRYAEDESGMWWIDVPGFNMFHCINAWEEDEGNSITIVATNTTSVEHVIERIELSQVALEMITINVKEKTLERHPLSARFLEFAVINPAYATMKNRYVYAAVIEEKTTVGVAKLDLSLTSADGQDCTVACRLYGRGWCGGEPFFVAREPNNPAAEEDDGYLVTYVLDEINGEESKFLVMDAKSPTLDIVAAVKLPRWTPTGLHGIFLPQADINAMHS